MRRLLPALALAAFPLTPAHAAGEALTCTNVVKAGDTADTIRARFKGETAIEETTGAEGASARALAIFPKDPARKLFVSFFDDEMKKLAAIGPAPGATHWSIGGLQIGSTLADVIKANGGKFEMSGFEWDYGGYITDLKGGKLSSLEGGCIVTVRFNPPEGKEVPAALSGEKSIASADPKLAKLNPYVSEIQLGWAGDDAAQGSGD
ncbi:MAG TPA: hypothetical protein VE079_02100 [Ensifer sp.]|nr:hypothetical protein [Ensifer sp.]